MKKIVCLLHVLFFCNCFQAQSGSVTSEPRKITSSFISDFKNWNDHALGSKNYKKAEADFTDKILRKYCLASKKVSGIEYNTFSKHDPLYEKIVFENTRDYVSVIVTHFQNENLGLACKYEYHIAKIDGNWYLNDVFQIDGKVRTRTL